MEVETSSRGWRWPPLRGRNGGYGQRVCPGQGEKLRVTCPGAYPFGTVGLRQEAEAEGGQPGQTPAPVERSAGASACVLKVRYRPTAAFTHGLARGTNWSRR